MSQSWLDRQAPIVALATAPGRGAVGIIRVSGRGLLPLIRALCGRELTPRVAHYGPFRDARGEAIDHGLALFFPGPHSYTGEDVLELQGHGGPVVMQLLLARCLEAAAEADVDADPSANPSTDQGAEAPQPRLKGLRLAEPGEFTQRAFLTDKIDLAQAEAIADLIDASTEAAARSATRSLGGAFSREIEALRAAASVLASIRSAIASPCARSILSLRKARSENSPGSARRRCASVGWPSGCGCAAASRQRASSSCNTTGPPCACSSSTSSPVKEWGAGKYSASPWSIATPWPSRNPV